MSKQVVVEVPDDTVEDGHTLLRVDLDKCQVLRYSTFYEHGVAVTAVYLQPRARRLVVETDSAWDDGTGCRTGIQYHIATSDEVARMVRDGLDMEAVVDLIPELIDG